MGRFDDRHLEALGWQPGFARQIRSNERACLPARVSGVRRRTLNVVTANGERELHFGGRWFLLPPEDRPTIGDWVLLDSAGKTVVRLLARKTVLLRRAPGRNHELQLLAANVDTLFIVTSCNDEFSPARIERYLALALAAGVQPVVVLTKIDQVDDPEPFRARVAALLPDLPVETVDARDPATLAGIRAWCHSGQTVALLGSSGVGKSTLVNSLAGAELQLTASIRETDAKGRHTTTRRTLHHLADGAVLLDTPGMRELTLGEVGEGVLELFSDVTSLAARCRFSDCRHEAEPDCAVKVALQNGTLDPRRLESFRKLSGAG